MNKAREDALKEYYKSPNICKKCNQVINIPSDKKIRDIKKKQFCNKSCAVSFNNSIHSKRIKKEKKIVAIEMRKCNWHACQNQTKTIYCSKKCKNKHCVTDRRRELKRMSIEYKGGKCSICNYNKSAAAFDFHHLSENEKEFSISDSGITRSWEKIKIELDKCILLCANCHREVHEKLATEIEVRNISNK